MIVNQVISSKIQSSSKFVRKFCTINKWNNFFNCFWNRETSVDTTITPTSMLLNNPQVIQEKEHKKEVENLWLMSNREKVKGKEMRTRRNNL
jgi:hypothetical protein